MHAKDLLNLAFILIGAGLVGCGSARVSAHHTPAHPSDTQPVTLRAEAKGSVDRVELAIKRYTLSVSNGALSQTLVADWNTVKVCNPTDTASTLVCEHTMPSAFPDNSLVEFRARAWDSEGKNRADRYSFAAGAYPLPDDPIPIRLKGDTDDHLDVVFVRDTDITAADFNTKLPDVVKDIFFKYDDIKRWRGLYNFYYTPEAGNYEESCDFTDPSNMANLTAVGDAILILHQTRLRDCRSGKKISSEIDYDKSMIHETGHVLFNVQDEYCCDSSYTAQACEPNLWASLSECESAAPGLGLDASDCFQLSNGTATLEYWAIDHAGSGGCMMGNRQHSADSDFGVACKKRIDWRYAKCVTGQCFTSPACP